MKAYNPKDWTKLIFAFHKTDTFRQLIPAIIGLTLFSTVLCYFIVHLKWIEMRSTTVMHSLLGFVISMLLVFRTNTAYDRWWEGRRMWGDLVNNSRNLMMKINAFIPSEKIELKKRWRILISNYPFALKEHLRGGFIAEELEDTDTLRAIELREYKHIPNVLSDQLFKELENLKVEKCISDEKMLLLNDEVKSLANICGACERIKGTPIPYSYSTFIKRIIFLYSITLPLGLVADLKWATVPIAVFVFYTLASIELIAEEIEDPFGKDTNDLPTDDIAHRIKANLLELEKRF
ncbi:MAG TPA: bestrophin family protein [Bacteroidia bacterium]|nr:bestrophin family protein [Bacteroidia bacterium]HRH06939.1 bestrophin family protein [Bacteroidia bacterium]